MLVVSVFVVVWCVRTIYLLLLLCLPIPPLFSSHSPFLSSSSPFYCLLIPLLFSSHFLRVHPAPNLPPPTKYTQGPVFDGRSRTRDGRVLGWIDRMFRAASDGAMGSPARKFGRPKPAIAVCFVAWVMGYCWLCVI